MLKKIISVVMAAVVLMTATAVTSVNADAANASRASQVITALGIMNTDDAKTYNTKAGVTRAEYAQMLVNMSTYKDMLGQETNISLFKDVSKKHWAVSYIKVAISEQWMSGYLNGKFMPDQKITLQEAANGVIKLLGYANSDFSGNKNAAKMTLYYSKDLDKNIKKTKNQAISKTDCMNLLYNTLVATTKAGTVYGTTLGYALDASGEIDYLSLVNKKMKGPVIAELNWESTLPIDTNTATYYRNSAPSTKNSIQLYDVLYYSQTLNTVWAYSDKVSGTVEKIAPNSLNPTEVTIAGNVIKIGTQEMSYEFSTLGSIEKGDVITALLGKDGSVVGILTENQYQATVNGTIVATGEKTSSNTTNNKLSIRKYIVVVDASGREHTFEYDKDGKEFIKGGIVIVTYSGDTAVIDYDYQRYDDPISGLVNQEGTALGQYSFAPDIQILDIQDGQYMKIYPSRLAGVSLLSSQILHYNTNANGQINEMILKNVTGDLDSYGILLSTDYAADETMGDATFLNTYTYLLKDVKSKIASSKVIVSLTAGPKRFSFNGTELDELANLNAFSVQSIKGTRVQYYNEDYYTLSDKVVVYYLKKSEYYYTTLEAVSDLSKFNLTAYYDKAKQQGGRVRVIVAQDK